MILETKQVEMSSNPITKAINDKTHGVEKTTKSSLERQVESAEFYGVLPSSSEQEPQKRGRGRPPNKSKSPGPAPTPKDAPKAQGVEKPTDEKVNKVLDDLKRNQLITKIRAYACYWPEICTQSLNDLNIYLCTTEQLERIINGFEASVMMQTEIVDTPKTVKEFLCKIEPVAVGLALSNPDHRVLREGVRLTGLSRALCTDSTVDRNVKLFSVKYLIGRLPRNPILNLLYSIVMVALDVYKTNTIQEVSDDTAADDKYADL